MKQILDYMPLDIVPHPDGFVIIEPDKKDQDGRLRISFWFYNLKTMVVQKVQVWRDSAGEYQADEQAGVARLSWRVSGR